MILQSAQVARLGLRQQLVDRRPAAVDFVDELLNVPGEAHPLVLQCREPGFQGSDVAAVPLLRACDDHQVDLWMDHRAQPSTGDLTIRGAIVGAVEHEALT